MQFFKRQALVKQKIELLRYRISQKTLAVIGGGAVLFAALSLGLIGFLWSAKVHQDVQTDPAVPAESVAGPSSPTLPAAAVAPAGQGQLDSSRIKQAMADCDVEAAKNPDGLYFLLTPVVPVNFESATLLQPPGESYEGFFLIQSQAVLGGLADSSLDISMRPYQFSIVDLDTSRIQKWSAIEGPSKFMQPNTPAFSKFQMGLEWGDKAVRWTHAYERQKATCYWVNVFYPGQVYASRSGRVGMGVPKGFPASARTLRCANHACDLDANP